MDSNTNDSLERLPASAGSVRPDGKGQCQFASLSTATVPRCTKAATHRWGGCWFCAEHGKRSKHSQNNQITNKGSDDGR